MIDSEAKETAATKKELDFYKSNSFDCSFKKKITIHLSLAAIVSSGLLFSIKNYSDLKKENLGITLKTKKLKKEKDESIRARDKIKRIKEYIKKIKTSSVPVENFKLEFLEKITNEIKDRFKPEDFLIKASEIENKTDEVYKEIKINLNFKVKNEEQSRDLIDFMLTVLPGRVIVADLSLIKSDPFKIDAKVNLNWKYTLPYDETIFYEKQN